jgi:serine/threonine protein kinase
LAVGQRSEFVKKWVQAPAHVESPTGFAEWPGASPHFFTNAQESGLMAILVEAHAEPIPGYRLIERLGGGGFGEVWKAEAPGGLLKAIKFVHGDMNSMGGDSQRADQELKALKRVTTVRHPYVLSLERFDIIDGRLMIVMELADRNLWDRFKECRGQGLPGIPRAELLQYMHDSAEALDLMNIQYQLQHLDIKPQNLFLVHNHVKVADFGLVKDLHSRMAASITGGVTPVYAAPETFDGWVSRFCDQYSLAIVYQELLTGQRPFSGNTVHHVVMQHVQGKPKVDPLPPGDREVIRRALSKNPDDRHPTCLDLVRLLQSSSAETAGPHKPSAVQGPGVVAEDQPPNRESSHFSPAPLPPGPEGENGLSTTAALPILDKRAPIFAPRDDSASQAPEEAVTPASSLPEVTGEGQLVPALVLGLGEMGLAALCHLRGDLQEQFESLDNLPHLRFLYIDTDPEGGAQATEPGAKTALTRREVLVARLHRAGYFLNPRLGGPKIDKWFDTAMLYRIQRNQVTGGLRALGRLALFANYKQIITRLKAELDACSDPEAITTAGEKTGMGLRSNQPRVYIITSLAGGTGGGMFIDLAYIVRDMMRTMGYLNPEVTGLFFLPDPDPDRSRPLALGNAYAALTELNHFSSPDIVFSACYEERAAPIKGTGPPFNRCIFLQGSADPEASVSAHLAGTYVSQELTSPLGQLADSHRATETMLGAGGTIMCQTFGLYRYLWPRRALLQEASRRYCRHLVLRWMAKQTKTLQEHVTGWVQKQWTDNELGAEFLITRFREAGEKALGREPESAFAAVTDPLVGRQRRLIEADRDGVYEAFAKLEEMVGRPVETSVLIRPGILEETLRTQGEILTAEWQQKLSQFTLHLVDNPEFRLAGTEEAVRQAGGFIEEILTRHEILCQELSEKAAKGHERLHFLVSNYTELFKGRRAPQLLAELGELLQLYPKWRYQALVLRRVIFTFTSLRGYLSDQIREIGFFRLRFGELLAAFERPVASDTATANLNGTFLFPPGCETLEEAVGQLVPEATSAELDDLDQRMQNLIGQQFGSLRNVCMTPSIPIRNLELAMLTETEAFVSNRLTQTNAVDTFFNLYADDASAEKELDAAFDNAAPQLEVADPHGASDLTVLAVPSGQEKRFRKVMGPSKADVKVIGTPHADDLVFYREETRFRISDLKQLGPAPMEAYQQMLATEHFTPHTRIDIAEWREPVPQ